jgi:hypothetical protein
VSFDISFAALTDPPGNATLTNERKAKLGAIVMRYGGPSTPDQHGYFGGWIEFYAGGREGGMLALREVGGEAMGFVSEVMREMDWGVFVNGEGARFLTARALGPSEHAFVPPRDVPHFVVTSVEALEAEIAGDLGRWADYRDQVVKGH